MFWQKILFACRYICYHGAVKNENMSNQKLAEELHKRIFKKYEKHKITPTFYGQYLGCWSYWYAINKQI